MYAITKTHDPVNYAKYAQYTQCTYLPRTASQTHVALLIAMKLAITSSFTKQ